MAIKLKPIPYVSQAILKSYSAFMNGIEIGFVQYVKRGKCVHVHQFEINYHLRGQGYGTKLYARVEKDFISENIKEVRLLAVESSGFWEKLGFKKGKEENIYKKWL